MLSLSLRRSPAAPRAFVSVAWRAFSSAKKSADTAKFEIKPFKAHKCDGPSATEVEASKDELMKYFKDMVVYRRMEIVSDTLYKQRKIRGFCHLYDGQEAIVTGTEAVYGPNDSVITAYRDHVHQVGRGDTPERVLAEMMAKATGSSKGKGGSMHLYLPEKNFYGGNGIVGAQVPVGAGVAFAHKYRGDGGVCAAFYGDGAANQGQIFEAANIAHLWKLPCLFVCENNEYGMGTAINRASASTDFYTRGDYVPGIYIDGMDVLAVKAGFQYALDYARENGPMFVEFHTYRYHGHSMSDPGISYRAREEVTSVRETRDPIEAVRRRLLEQGWASESELKDIEKQVRKDMNKAVKFAEESPEPEKSELYTEIYVGSPPPFIRAIEFEDSVRI